MRTIFKYEWKLFARNKSMIAAWLIILAAGIYSLYYGYSFNSTQTATIYRIDTAYQGRIKKQLDGFTADTTTKEGKSKFNTATDPFMNEWQTRSMVWKQPAPLQALSIGQSDNQPYYYNLWVYNNVYNTKQVELRNPAKLLAGNFDLAFVIIYLLPLLLIAFSYNVLSSDKEAGINGLLSVQGLPENKILKGRLLFRGLIIYSLVILLSVAGFVVNNIKDVYSIAGWLGTSFLYLLFWTALIFAIVSARKNSAVNALLLVGCWVLFLLFIPSVLNNFQRTTDPARVELADADREFSNHLWEMDKQKLIDTLYQVRPDWRKYTVRDTDEVRSIAYAYLDMLNMNKAGKAIDSSTVHDQQQLIRFNLINPAFATQLLFNKLARSESGDYIGFRKNAAAYQLERSEILNKHRWAGKKLTASDYKNYPSFQQSKTAINAAGWLWGILPLLVCTLVCWLIAKWNGAATK